jgi:bacterioferritin-associated ferredoxin
MYVCICNGVTEAAIRRAALSGIRTLAELAMSTGCTAGCGCCSEAAQESLHQALLQERNPIRPGGGSALMPASV